jgi:hypothetical protein
MALRGIVNRVIGGGRRGVGGAGGRRTVGGGMGPGMGAGPTGTTGGRRGQDEAIGRGVRKLFRRAR